MRYACAKCKKTINEKDAIKVGGGVIWNYFCSNKCKNEVDKTNKQAADIVTTISGVIIIGMILFLLIIYFN
jgi:hypothetical protein